MNMSTKIATVVTLAFFALIGCSTNNTVADDVKPSTNGVTPSTPSTGGNGDQMPQLHVPEYINISDGVQKWLDEGGTEKRLVYISDTWPARPEGTRLPFPYEDGLPFSGEVSLTAAEVKALIENYNGFAIKLAGEVIDTGVLNRQ